MPLHGSGHLAFGRTRLQIEDVIEGVQFEEVAMAAPGWAWPPVAQFAEIIFPLAAAFTQGAIVRDAFREAPTIGGQVKEDPMDKSPAGGIRIITNERKALGGGGHVIPAQRGGEVLAITGVLGGNRALVTKDGADELHRHLQIRRGEWARGWWGGTGGEEKAEADDRDR